MDNIYMITLAIICFGCVMLCDFLLQKVHTTSRVGKFVSKSIVRMALSYFSGIFLFLLGVRLLSTIL